MHNLDSILKSRDMTLPTKVHLVKAMVFPVVMYGCESWTMKKTERQRTDTFDLWCWRRLLSWTARRSNQSILKEISPKYSLEGLMSKLKLKYFGHLMQGTDSLEKTLMLGKIEDRGEGDGRGGDGWMASVTQWTWVWVSSGSWQWTGKPTVLQSIRSQRVGHDWVTELNWGDGGTPLLKQCARWVIREHIKTKGTFKKTISRGHFKAYWCFFLLLGKHRIQAPDR